MLEDSIVDPIASCASRCSSDRDDFAALAYDAERFAANGLPFCATFDYAIGGDFKIETACTAVEAEVNLAGYGQCYEENMAAGDLDLNIPLFPIRLQDLGGTGRVSSREIHRAARQHR